MLKSAIILAIPGALGGISLLYGGLEGPAGQGPRFGAYHIEVGVAFPEAAVRGALPEGLEPAPGFTGGIAIHDGLEGSAQSPRSAGFVWIDVMTDGAPARYALRDFESEIYQDTSPVALSAEALSELHELEGDVLHVIAWPDRMSGLELVVKPTSAACAQGTGGDGEVLASNPDGSLGVIDRPTTGGWCVSEAEVAWASITAPPGHVLRPFLPRQVLWAELATPPGYGVAAP